MAPPDVAERVALAPAPGEAPLPAANAAALLRRNGTDPDYRAAAGPALRRPHLDPRRDATPRPAASPALFAERLDPARPPHVAVLLDNTPEYVFALAGAGADRGGAWWGSTTPGATSTCSPTSPTPTCRCVITEPRHQELLAPVVGELALPGGLLVSERFADGDDPAPHHGRVPRPRPGRRGRRAPATPGVEPDVGAAVGAAVHLGHLGRAQGGALHPAPPAHHRATG